MRKITALLALGAMMAVPIQVSAAHPTREFQACARLDAGDCFVRGAAFAYGDTVIIRGRVSPTHSGLEARVLRRVPGGDGWHVVDTVPVTRRGKMFHLWQTRRADAVQDEPYLFKFRIPGHGVSNATEAFVLFGE